MKRYVKNFDSILNEMQNQKEEKVNEVKVSFKDFLKLAQNENYNPNSGGDVTLQFKENVNIEDLDFSSVKKVNIIEENWNDISNAQTNYLRKNGIYTFDEFLDYAKNIFKTKFLHNEKTNPFY
jgi:hypothetical protein